MIVSRFAPAPTGYLHLGHVLNALHVWGITRALGGRVLLRIEDHDRQRCRPEYEAAILDDLDWLGFGPDDPPTSAFRAGPCRGRQRDREDVYEAALASLQARTFRGARVGAGGDRRHHEGGPVVDDDRAHDGAWRDRAAARDSPGPWPLVYACSCRRRELREAMDASGRGAAVDAELAGVAPDAELRYSGRCATRGLAWHPGLGLRVRLEDTLERFVDLRHGRQEQRPFEQCGDILVKDRDGNWTYQFAVTVDDLAQGVTLVIRGDDLLASTGRQILLARLLGRDEPPRFLHHPLVMKGATQKLSKADRDTSVRDMRASGATVEEIVGRTLHAAGFTASAAPLARAEAEALVAARYAEGLRGLAERA